MKFDKDTVIKHHFWFLLATAMPLALVGILILMTVVSAEIAKNRKDLDSALKGANVSDAKNDEWITQKRKEVDKAKIREKEVWEEAYNLQKNLFTWPDEIERKFDFKHGFFASVIKADKGAAVAPVDPKTEELSPIKHFNGTVVAVDEDPETNVVTMKVSDGKERPRIFRPMRKMNLTRDGKTINHPRGFEKGDKVAITYVVGKYFNDPLTDEEQNLFGDADRGYKTQIAGIIEKVQPLKVKGDGVVQLGTWLYGHQKNQPILPEGNAPFFRYVAKEWDVRGDISAEAWMAQEDLWIQRELYGLVRQANDMVSVLQGKGGAEENKWYTFTNPYWKLDLNLANKKVSAKIKNLLSRRQRLDFSFLVTFREGENVEPIKVRIPGEPIDPGEERVIDPQPIVGLPSGIYRVEQEINWESAAVKRIEQISMGSLAESDCCHSHRTFPEGLKSFAPAPVKAAAPGPGGPPGGPGGDMKMPQGLGGKGGLGAGKEEGKKTRNGLSPERYIEQPTPQVRRVPFGISLIVGQEHIDRILFVFSKSPLRILMTQVIIDRYPHSVRPTGLNQGGQGNAPGGRVGGGGLGIPGFPGGFGGIGQNAPAPAAGGNSQETNMEMVIYGIASLYQRYPPRPAESATPAQAP